MTALPDQFKTATSALSTNGWCILSNLLSPAQTLALATECGAMHDAHQAAILAAHDEDEAITLLLLS